MAYFEDLWECFNDTSVFITIHLDDINKGYFCLGPITEWFEDWCVFLGDRERMVRNVS